jgi:hypothetical protein
VKVFVGCYSLRALAVGDVARWAEPVRLLGEAMLERLELIGRRFGSFSVAAVSGWLTDEADVVNTSFVRRTLGRLSACLPFGRPVDGVRLKSDGL